MGIFPLEARLTNTETILGNREQKIDINGDFTCMHMETKCVIKIATGEGGLLINCL